MVPVLALLASDTPSGCGSRPPCSGGLRPPATFWQPFGLAGVWVFGHIFQYFLRVRRQPLGLSALRVGEFHPGGTMPIHPIAASRFPSHHPGGMSDRSRGLSAAIPPESPNLKIASRKGCQSASPPTSFTTSVKHCALGSCCSGAGFGASFMPNSIPDEVKARLIADETEER